MTEPDLKALIVDWGGVLTSGLSDAMRGWCEADDIDDELFERVMRDWLGPSLGDEVRANPVHALERGEMHVPHFEAELARRLRTRDGAPVPADGLLERMFAGFGHAHDMQAAVRRVKRAGLKTALLSNSWGNNYPREGWAQTFDVVVISGEVGMRKPEPEIYLHTATALGVAPPACVFVDDLPANVYGAAAVGMVGIQHRTYDETINELEALLGLRLR